MHGNDVLSVPFPPSRCGALGLFLALGLPALSAQEEPAFPRRLVDLAPEGTAAWFEWGGCDLDVASLHERLEREAERSSLLPRLLRSSELRRIRGMLRLTRGLERNGLVAGFEDLLAGRLVFGLRKEGRRVRAFALAKLRAPSEAGSLQRRLRALGLEVDRRGPYLALAGDGRTREAIGRAWERAARGEGPPAFVTDLPARSLLRFRIDLQELRRTRFPLLGDRSPVPAFPAFLGWPLLLSLSRGETVEGGVAVAADGGLVLEVAAKLGGIEESLRIPLAPLPAAGGRDSLREGGKVLPRLEGTICRWRLGRDLAAFLEGRARLLGPRARRQTESFLQSLDFALRGPRGGSSLLQALAPGLSGLLVLSTEEDRRNRPVRLLDPPVLVLGFPLRESGPVRRVESALGVLLAVSNRDRMRRGRLPRRVRTETRDGIRLSAAKLVTPKDGRPWPLEAVVTPTLAHGASWLLVGSEDGPCRRILFRERRQDRRSAGRNTGGDRAGGRRRGGAEESGLLDLLEFDFAAAAEALRRNRKLLASRLLVERGTDPERGMALLETIAQFVERMGRVRFTDGIGEGKVWMRIRWTPAPAADRNPGEAGGRGGRER